ncbi:hypothetical protein AXF42_Ash017225 [Apostasia shenzhenica]|uniref:Uncharacterized protein n=1 Tax=Apostasia shenzhenica TaxID=1088818 RepID=A0A2H9ZVG4_9ASPA|nr:hypothetical protein AXF42_Ash017225 [Apostasia shenzhenica]
MEACHGSLAKPSNLFCKFSLHSRFHNCSTQFRRERPKRLADYLALLLKSSSWGSPATPLSGISPVYSLFRRPFRRRNSLREKLVIPRQDQVRILTEASEPVHRLQNSRQKEHESNGHGLGFDFDGKKEAAGSEDHKNISVSGNSALWDRLENWADRYKEESEFWGIGTSPIFTIYQDSDGNVIRVSVNEDEIVKRNRIHAWLLKDKKDIDEFKDANSKISRARLIAKDIEVGKCIMPKSSSIVKFVVEGKKSPFINVIHVLSSRREALVKIFPQISLTVLCCFCIFGAARNLFLGNKKVELTGEEAEMLRRKKKLRMERERSQQGSVELIQNGDELPVFSGSVPHLDKNELMKNIMQAKKSRENLLLSSSSGHLYEKSPDFDGKVREIREMVKRVREVEQRHHAPSKIECEQDDLPSIPDDSNIKSGIVEDDSLHKSASINGSSYLNAVKTAFQADREKDTDSKREAPNNSGPCTADIIQNMNGQETNIQETSEKMHVNLAHRQHDEKNKVDKNRLGEEAKKLDTSSVERGKLKIITSLKEAKEYLALKSKIPTDLVQAVGAAHSKRVPAVLSLHSSSDSTDVCLPQSLAFDVASDFKSHTSNATNKNSSLETKESMEIDVKFQNNLSNGESQETIYVNGVDYSDGFLMGRKISGFLGPSTDCTTSGPKNLDDDLTLQYPNQMLQRISHAEEFTFLPGEEHEQAAEHIATFSDVTKKETEVNRDSPADKQNDFLSSSELVSEPEIAESAENRLENNNTKVNASYISSMSDAMKILSPKVNVPLESHIAGSQKALPEISIKSWTEENFERFDCVIKKIAVGFRDNYMMAKEKVQENSRLSDEQSKLGLWGENEELEWMKDENLREIVFQVKENELAGRDPFHLMDADDQTIFFQGLEHEAEIVNAKLVGLHNLIHSRIDNLNYGADGISLDDPLEKIIPRWKGPPIHEDPQFLKNHSNVETPIFPENVRDSYNHVENKPDNLLKSNEMTNSSSESPYSPAKTGTNLSPNGTSVASKTLIECSDGSSRPGKKKGKEQWKHTKRWSQGFLEVYNSEMDPEVKSILKDMGKDLDRWITEKELKDVANLMTKIPKKKRRFIEKKMNRIKREVEKYGAQAVVSKYKEFAGEKEEDYLWWLDLQFVLCIELYTVDEDVPRIGFYSLEMAEDLELNPKQYHVIAFEDAGDSKNFCHIVQAHMDMLGSGRAFVVARPPKDAFREAKSSGFNITVIRKGDIKLNVDQTLEEVEEELKDIGSKIYHDKIMNERGVDIHSLTKGVLAADKSIRRTLGKFNTSCHRQAGGSQDASLKL